MSTGLSSYAINRIFELEVINASLREELSSSNSHIAMLEEKILDMSIELASTRAREDEHNLMIRRRLSQVSMMSEDDGNSNRAPTSAELIDDSIRSAFSSSSHRQFQRRFSLPSWLSSSSTTQEDINESMRSLGSSAGGLGGIVSNMAKELDRSENLRVDFPTGGRHLFRISDITVDYTPEEETCELQEHKTHDDEEGEKQSSPQRRRPNRSLLKQPHMGSDNSRLISSTIIFPRENDDGNLGFE